MSGELFVIIGVIAVGFVTLGFFVRNELGKVDKNGNDATLIEWLKSMQASIETTNKNLNESMRGTSADMSRTMRESTRELNERLDTAARIVGDLKKNLGEMSEVGKGIRSLQEFLQSPKLRGNLGEQVLSDMIGQSFPKNSFHLQFTFRSGAKVDAVLKTDAGLLPIDAKFPMENFTLMHTAESEADREKAKKLFVSDVKKHIGDISKKYILPEEGTMDFALMYIPSEAVYYDVANSAELTEYARKQRVYPVSPNTLYAHLQVLLLSFQGKELEDKSREVIRLLKAIGKDYEKVENELSVLTKHVTNAHNTMSNVTGSFNLLGQKISRSSSFLFDRPKQGEDSD